MPQWIVRIDRRKANYQAVINEIQILTAGIQGLDTTFEPTPSYQNAPDGGAFRDFVAVATISHAKVEALEYVGEVLLEAFGWLIDFQHCTDN